MTRIIDRMNDEGLVIRERPEHDRRVVLVRLAPAGTELLGRARAFHRDGSRRHSTDRVTPAARDGLVAALATVREHVREVRPGRVSG